MTDDYLLKFKYMKRHNLQYFDCICQSELKYTIAAIKQEIDLLKHNLKDKEILLKRMQKEGKIVCKL